MNQPGQITPWWVTQNQQRAAAQQQAQSNWINQPNATQNWANQQNWMTQQSLPVQNPQVYGRPMNPVIPGRLIQTPTEIMPDEVPMNGSVSLFPSSDYSYIIAKSWNQNGTIDTVKFVPEPMIVNQEPAEQDPFKAEVLNRFDKLEQMLGYKSRSNPDKKTPKEPRSADDQPKEVHKNE